MYRMPRITELRQTQRVNKLWNKLTPVLLFQCPKACGKNPVVPTMYEGSCLQSDQREV